MRVALVTEFAEDDVRSFSGIPYFMRRELARHVSIERVQVPRLRFPTVFTDPDAAEADLRRIGAEASAALKEMRVDAVVCQGSTMLPFLDTEHPVVLWHDSTWHTLMRLDFEEFVHDHPLLARWDRAVLDRCARVVYAAAWVRDASLRHYLAPPERLRVIPFGPSFDEPGEADVRNAVAARHASARTLTFVGVDWLRKGLALAASVATRLDLAGVPATLDVIGPPLDARALDDPSWRPANGFVATSLLEARLSAHPAVRRLGFVDKATHPGVVERVLLGSHYLLHPAEFECFGVAMVEALACGVPVLAVEGHGADTVVASGRAGRTFAAADYAQGATEWIAGHLADGSYEEAALDAWADYRGRLGWRNSCAAFLDVLAELA